MSQIEPDLRVPGPYLSTLMSFARLDDGEVARLVDALNQPKTKYDRREVAEVVTRILGWSSRDGETLTEILLSMPALRRAINAPGVEAVTKALASSRDFGTEDLDRDALARHLTEAVNSLAFDLLARGQELIGEYEHSFISARILSDIRPTFAFGSNSQVDGAVVVHSLRLRYQDLEPREIVLTLDLQDLKALRQIVSRAVLKEDALAELLSRAGVPFVRPEDSEAESDRESGSV